MRGIQLDMNDMDLVLEDYNMTISDTDSQAAQIVLLANRGELKEYPLIGGEVIKLRNSNPDPMWPSDVKYMLQACGLNIKSVEYSDDNVITIN